MNENFSEKSGHGIWQDAAMRIRIIHWNPHLPHNSDIFRKKTEEISDISDKAAP